MIRLCSLTLCATLSVGLLACGSNAPAGGESSKKAVDLMPGDSDVSGWKVDLSANKNKDGAPMTATSKEQAIGLIDGGAEPFYIDPYKAKVFAWQNYVNTTLPSVPQPDKATILMYVVEMPSADQAKGLYTAVLDINEYARKKGSEDDWVPTTPALGEASRIQDTGSMWWINFRQGVFYVELQLTPSTGPEPNYTPHNPETKAEAMKFAQAVVARF